MTTLNHPPPLASAYEHPKKDTIPSFSQYKKQYTTVAYTFCIDPCTLMSELLINAATLTMTVTDDLLV